MLCAVMVTVSLSGCENMGKIGNIVSGVTAAGEFPVEINGVTISAKPTKAIVLSPGLADVILALGCETQLLAGSEGCTQDSLRDLQKISGEDAQAVIGLAPDLVISDSFDEGMTAALSDAGITMLAVSPATDREDFERLYSQVSAAFSGGGAGYDAGIVRAQEIFTVLDDISRIVPKETVTTACYLYDLDGTAVTGDMFASTLMSCAGVTNAFSSDKGGTYQFQSLRISNPNVIFCVPGLKEQMKANADFSKLRAVKENKVFELDPSLMEWQGRTIFPGQLVTSAARMGADLGFTRQQIRTALDKLKSTNEITVEATNRFSVITVVNWDEYQFYSEKQTNKKTKPLTVQQPSNNQQITIKQPQRKNDKKYTSYIKEEKKAAAPQEVFPPGIETQEELEALKARLRE